MRNHPDGNFDKRRFFVDERIHYSDKDYFCGEENQALH